MKVGFIGLGRMGSQMVARLLDAGHEVVALDNDPAATDQAVALGAAGAASRTDLVRRLGDEPVVWLMVPAPAVDNVLGDLLDALPEGGVIVDGGNSDFRQTQHRAAEAKGRGMHFVDVGTSGGVLGRGEGFSLMVGGEGAVVERLAPLFEALAQPGGWAHFGPSGAGHYLKMVHNAIEYGLMEAYAEGYRLLHEGRDYPGLDLAQAAEVWQHGSIVASKLNGVAHEALSANPDLDGITGYVAETGEARWALETAAAQKLPMPSIQAAMDMRLASQHGETSFGTKLLAAMRNIFGGHSVNQ